MAANKRTAATVEAEIKKLEDGIKSNATPAQFKAGLEAKKEKLQSELSELKKAPKVKEKVFKTTKEKEKAGGKKTAKPAAAKKEAKPAKKGSVKKAAPVKATKPAKAKEDKDAEAITIQGIKITKDGCPQGYEAFKKYRDEKRKSSQKSEAKPEINKGRGSFESGFTHIFEAIPQATIDKDPSGVKKALNSFKANMDKAFASLKPILSKTQVEELGKALSSIDKIVKEVADKAKK